MPYIRNGWYCIGFAHQLQDKPIAIRVLDEPIIIYRTSTGKPVALLDRCPHRFAPLSMGRVNGNDIECPYHGLRFGPDGGCTLNPHGTHVLPKSARVPAYTIVERDTLLWMWPGDQRQADAAVVPDFTSFFGLPDRGIVHGYFNLKAHYELVLDNLMDLSHAPFLHAGTLAEGPADTNVLRVETETRTDEVIARHLMDGVRPNPQFAPFWRAPGAVGDFRANMHWQAPGTLRLDVGICERGRPHDTGPNLHFGHLITPATSRETHYFWAASRNFEVSNLQISQLVQGSIQRAFVTEDEPMIEAVQSRMISEDIFAMNPVLLRGDEAGVLVRRALHRKRQAERTSAEA